MSWAALTSGGKDSILSIQKALDAGMDVSRMITVVPENTESYMFHSANLKAVPVMAERAGMAYTEIRSAGEKEQEILDMQAGIARLDIEGLIVGAIASEYQRSRVAAVCRALGLKLFAPLWGMAPLDVLREVASRMDARIVVTAADGLGENVLGKRIDEALISVLLAAEKKRRIHIAGEGGEYESLVFNAPFFSSPLNASGMQVRCSGMAGKAVWERFW
ncbi:MAG: diphthine--ammonia ligase [Methanocorpusculum sp.]|nr:diphthine--ammonia ligase [Methanocorpusculum sp.]